MSEVRRQSDFADIVGFSIYPIPPLIAKLGSPGHDDRIVDHQEAIDGDMGWLAANLAERHNHAPERISVVPTVVDADDFRPSHSGRDAGHFTIGWIGTPRGTAYLRSLRDAMKSVAQRLPQARLLFVGAEPFDCGDVPVEFRAWRLDREIADIQSFDVGIMPMFDDEEARGKCGFKLIAYMSTGMPVVCSPVGANVDIVDDGRSGLFAETPEQWSNALIRLGENAELRRTFGDKGRSRVESQFCLAIVALQLLKILRGSTGD